MSIPPACPVPPILSDVPKQDDIEPPNKKLKETNEMSQNSENETKVDENEKQKMLNIAVAGCSHGEMDLIYSTLAVMERNRGIKFDLLICCGDYQSIRNMSDLNTMHVHRKYRQLGTFHHYYSGEKQAPIFTIFIGGNHEATSFLAELPHGGWVAPNIYYMGYSSVVKFGGLRIGGLSGIYKSQDYNRGHYECPPFSEGSMISAYHVRSVDVFRLKQLARRDDDLNRLNCLDIMISHDWPCGITDYGDTEKLLRFKKHFTEDINNCRLGNPTTMDILHKLKPRYWFAAHLHCRYEAKVEHDSIQTNEIEKKPEDTKFLALDKPIRGRKFLEAIQIPLPEDVDEITFEYDPIWLAILKNSDHLTEVNKGAVYMPSKASAGVEKFDFRPSTEEIEQVLKDFGDLKIPNNFKQTGRPYVPGEAQNEQWYYINPQTTEFCEKLKIKNLNQMLYESDNRCRGTPFYISSKNPNVENQDEIDIDNIDEDNVETENNVDFVLDDGPESHAEV